MRWNWVRRSIVVAAVLAVLISEWSAEALMIVGRQDEVVVNQGWPTGAEAVANLPGRVGGYDLGSRGDEHHFRFQCRDTDEFNEALRVFGAIRAPRLTRTDTVYSVGVLRSSGASDAGKAFSSGETCVADIVDDKSLLLVVHDRPAYEGDASDRVDWVFTIESPRGYHTIYNATKGAMLSDASRYGRPALPPRMDLFLRPGGPVDWSKVAVPKSVRVIDKRSGGKGGVVRGGVFSMTTHQAIAGASVVLVKDGKEVLRTTTDDAGRFERAGISKGVYHVRIEATNYATRDMGRFNNPGGNGLRDFDAILAPVQTLAGKVVDTAGKPVVGAEVRANGIRGIDGYAYSCPGIAPTATDALGRFELPSLPMGSVSLRCRHDIGSRQKSSLEVYEVGRMTMSGAMEEAVVVMERTGALRVGVVGPDGKPATRRFMVDCHPPGGPKVGMWSGSAALREGEKHLFLEMPPGEYVVVAHRVEWKARGNGVLEMDGHALPQAGAADARQGKRVTVKAGETTEVEIVSWEARKE